MNSAERIDPRIARELRDGLVDYDPEAERQAAGVLALLVVLGFMAAAFAFGVALGHWGWR